MDSVNQTNRLNLVDKDTEKSDKSSSAEMGTNVLQKDVLLLSLVSTYVNGVCRSDNG